MLVATVLDAIMWLMPDMFKHGGRFKSFWRLLVMLVEEKEEAVRAPVAGHLLQRKMLGMTLDMLEQDDSVVQVLHAAPKARAQLLVGLDLVSKAFKAGDLTDGLEPVAAPLHRNIYSQVPNPNSRRFLSHGGRLYLHFTYRALNGLMRAALPVLGEGGSPSQQAPSTTLSPPEIAMMQSTHWLEDTLAHQMTTRRCANWLQHTFVQCAWGNQDVSKVLIDKGIALMNAGAYNQQHASHRLFSVLLGMEDSVAVSRREYLLVRYWDALRQRSNGYLETLYGLELALRHAKHHTAVRKWMARSPSAWSWATAWLAENRAQPAHSYTHVHVQGLSLTKFHAGYGLQFKMPRHPNLLANYRELFRTAVNASAARGVTLPGVDAVTAGLESVQSADDAAVDVDHDDAPVPDTTLFDSGYDSEDDTSSLVGKHIRLCSVHTGAYREGEVLEADDAQHTISWASGVTSQENLSHQFFTIVEENLAPEVQQQLNQVAARPPAAPPTDMMRPSTLDSEDSDEDAVTHSSVLLPGVEPNPWGEVGVGHTTGAHGRVGRYTGY
jgi:hypothetical protein